MIARAFVLGATVGLGACSAGSRAEQAAAAPVSDTVTVTGVVRAMGAEPLVQHVVQPAGGEGTALAGALLSELQQLVGLEVRVTGVPAGPAPPAVRALDVRSYEVLALNGTPARTGVLERAGDGLQLVAAHGRWTLLNPPDELRRAVGATVWVAGDSSDGRLPVSAYGIIKPRP